MDGVGNYTCNCTMSPDTKKPLWEGKLCEKDVNECLDNTTCMYGGQCMNKPGDFECKCKPLIVGRFIMMHCSSFCLKILLCYSVKEYKN